MPDLNNTQLHSLIAHRRSSRIMASEQPITREQIAALMEAARWAPSAGNRQPWHYLIFDVHDMESLSRARDCLSNDNQLWARHAPLLILSIVQTNRDDGKPNPKALHDLGLANQNLLLQAIAMGLNCRPMGGFKADRAREIFNIPEGFQPVVMIAAGYPGQIQDFPEVVQNDEKEPRTRKEICAFVHYGCWGNGFPKFQ